MLLHPIVKFSTFRAPSRGKSEPRTSNTWLQCLAMRIELPSASWADAVHRAEDDAHTLTVAGLTSSDWAPLQLLPEGQVALAVRTEVEAPPPVALTLTF